MSDDLRDPGGISPEPLGFGGPLTSGKGATVEPAQMGAGSTPGAPSVFREAPDDPRPSSAFLEAIRYNAARIKKAQRFPLSDGDAKLLEKWAGMTPKDVEWAVLKGQTGRPTQSRNGARLTPFPGAGQAVAEMGETEPVQALPPEAVEEDEAEAVDLAPEPAPVEDQEGQFVSSKVEEPFPTTPIPRGIGVTHPMGKPDTPPLVLLNAMTTRWRADWIQWEPETIFAEVERQFGVSPPIQVQEKILCLQGLLQTTRAWDDWQVFQATAVTLAGRQARFDDVQDLSLAELDAAVRTMNRLRVQDLSDEVLSYIAAPAYRAGLVYLPKPLEQAQPFLDKLTKRPPLVDEVSRQWSRYSELDPALASTQRLGETPDGIQIARLLAIKAASRDLLGS